MSNSNAKAMSVFEFLKNDFVETITSYKNWVVKKYGKISTDIKTAYADYQKTRLKDLRKDTIKVPIRPHFMFYFYKHGSEIFTYFLSYFIMLGFFAIAMKNVKYTYIMIPLAIFSVIGIAYLIIKFKYYAKRWSK